MYALNRRESTRVVRHVVLTRAMRCDEIRDGDVVVRRRPSSSVVVVRRRLSLINQSIHPSVVVVVVVVHVARRTSTSRTRLKAPARDGDIFPRSRARSVFFLCHP